VLDLYPPVNEIIEQCGKFHLLDRLLQRLFARNHKVCFRLLCLCLSAWFFWCPISDSCALVFANYYQVLIFSQWTKVLDIMDYYFSEKGFEVCRIDGSVKLDDRKRQVMLA
jgi:ATP-dependent DNA helicase